MYASSLVSASQTIFRHPPRLFSHLCTRSSAEVPQRLGSVSKLGNSKGLDNSRGVQTRLRALRGEEQKSDSTVVVDQMPSLVSVEWLQSRVGNDNVKVLDGSWYLPVMERNAVEEFQQGRIPGASFFDVDGIADINSPNPHMAPSPGEFASAMDALNITNDTFVIVYDGMGIFSAPRVWWTFKAFGHEKVAVLDGGFPAWKELGCQIDASAVDESVIKNPTSAARSGIKDVKYQASFDPEQVRDLAGMLKLVSDGPNASDQIIDARPSGRFEGTVPEPRAGLRGGHMPGSLNVPFMDLITNGHMKPVGELKSVLQKAGVDFNKSHTASCGSGLTACVVIFAMHLIGLEQPKLYDGSWMEWGATEETPIVKLDTPKE